MQPTGNPYHCEVPQSRSGNICTWVKTSRTCTNEIVQQRAGPLNRIAAVLRSCHDGKFPNVDGNNGQAPFRRSWTKLTMHSSFSFECAKLQEDSGWTPEDIEEEDKLPDIIMRVDCGVLPPSATRTKRSHGEIYERPSVARTFSEILARDTFVPTALLEEK